MSLNRLVRRRGLIAMLGVLAIASTTSAFTPADRQRSAGETGKFIVHEWGTFLSVQGSDGKTLGGMVDSEENLPNFVRDRQLDGRNRACLLQKMETPVTYFYVDRPKTVEVRVGMNNGLLTHWYPATQSFGPAVGNDSAGTGSNSYLDWGTVELIPDTRVEMGPNLPIAGWKSVEPNDTWRFARETDAAFVGQRKKKVLPYTWNITTKNGHTTTGIVVREDESEVVLSTGPDKLASISKKDITKRDYIRDGRTAMVRDEGEWEKFLFYRGLGSMELPLQIRSSGTSNDLRLLLHNAGSGTLHGVFALEVAQSQIRFAELPALAGKAHQELAVAELKPAKNRQSVKDEVAAALVKAGLYPKEAMAMVNTWEKSYFQTDGLRVLYILPRSVVDEIIPIQVKPAPDKLERVMVGRVEVLTPEVERNLIEAVRNLSVGGTGTKLRAKATLARLGRLQEPALHRVAALAPTPEIKAQATALLQAVPGK